MPGGGQPIHGEWIRRIEEARELTSSGRSWFDPLLLPVLEAAIESPVVRELPPWTVLNRLVIEERFELPSIEVCSDGWYVLKPDGYDDTELFATKDPVEAVAMWTRLITVGPTPVPCARCQQPISDYTGKCPRCWMTVVPSAHPSRPLQDDD